MLSWGVRVFFGSEVEIRVLFWDFIFLELLCFLFIFSNFLI